MDATGTNMCQFDPSTLANQWQVYYAAMNEADWNSYGGYSICGQCIKVVGVHGQTAPGFRIKPVIVMIVDQCPSSGCARGSVDFSSTALQAITGYSWDKKMIKWEYVSCDQASASSTAARVQSPAPVPKPVPVPKPNLALKPKPKPKPVDAISSTYTAHSTSVSSSRSHGRGLRMDSIPRA